MHASMSNGNPTLPSVWVSEPITSMMLRSSATEPGAGFIDCVPGGLPAHIQAVLVNLSRVDHAWSDHRFRRWSSSETEAIREALNDAHHRVTSLRSWHDLGEEDRAASYLATYECCRLTCRLYSNSIIFPVTVNEWLLHLLQDIKALLLSANLQRWTDDTVPLLLWCLFVSSMAAYRTEESKFFEACLRKLLEENGLRTWKPVHKILQQFVWTDCGCAQGAAVIWDRCGME